MTTAVMTEAQINEALILRALWEQAIQAYRTRQQIIDDRASGDCTSDPLLMVRADAALWAGVIAIALATDPTRGATPSAAASNTTPTPPDSERLMHVRAKVAACAIALGYMPMPELPEGDNRVMWDLFLQLVLATQAGNAIRKQTFSAQLAVLHADHDAAWWLNRASTYATQGLPVGTRA